MNNNSNLEDPTTDTSLFEMNTNNDWRVPTASEAELILAWKREVLRAGRPLLYGFVFTLVLSITMIVLPLTGIGGPEWLIGSGIVAFLMSVFALVFFSGIFEQCKIKRGDYQILDSVAMTTFADPAGDYFVKVQTASGDLLDIFVDESVSKTITPDMPGLLFRYGKSTSSQKAKPYYCFIPIHGPDGQARGVPHLTSYRDWSLPNLSETERIVAWARKINRVNRPFCIASAVFFNLLLILVLLLPLIEHVSTGKYIFMILLAAVFAVFDDWTLILSLRGHKKLLSGDYQVLNTVVVSKSFVHAYRYRAHILQVRTPSGETIKVQVNKLIYAAVTENAPGFLVRVNGQKPKKNKGAGLSFFPAKSVDE